MMTATLLWWENQSDEKKWDYQKKYFPESKELFTESNLEEITQIFTHHIKNSINKKPDKKTVK